MHIPTLETARLRLRAHRVEDLNDFAALWADPAVTRYTSGKPLTREEVWARLLRYIGHWELMGYGFWAIEEPGSGQILGEVGVAEFQRGIEPALTLPEAGWILAGRAHGKGYGTEAVRAAVEWAETRFGSRGLTCIIHPENQPSLRLAAKCGFHEVRRAVYKDHPLIVFER
jgi:RimJ/RimL family protein N-acetyltransferase